MSYHQKVVILPLPLTFPTILLLNTTFYIFLQENSAGSHLAKLVQSSDNGELTLLLLLEDIVNLAFQLQAFKDICYRYWNWINIQIQYLIKEITALYPDPSEYLGLIPSTSSTSNNSRHTRAESTPLSLFPTNWAIDHITFQAAINYLDK